MRAAQLRFGCVNGLIGALDGGALCNERVERWRRRGRCGEVAGETGERQIGLTGSAVS